jgi:hypothetical protein
MSDLESNSKDRLVSAAKGVVGACPFIGALAAEAIGSLIPNQRLDRVVEFLRQLEKEVRNLDSRLDNFEKNLHNAEGLDIMEEGLVQAARSVSAERKERLAKLVARSLTREEMRYEDSRKLLNLFRELTDPELLWLIYYSMDPVLGPGPHRDLIDKHPDVLKPISRELGSSREQIDRAALQDSYKNTLLRFGLIDLQGNTHQITTLGRLMIRYIEDDDSDDNKS